MRLHHLYRLFAVPYPSCFKLYHSTCYVSFLFGFYSNYVHEFLKNINHQNTYIKLLLVQTVYKTVNPSDIRKRNYGR